MPGQQQLGHSSLGGIAFLDKETKGATATGGAGKPMNTLASIIDMSAADGYLDGPGAGGAGGPGLILGELDAFDDEALGKMKKGKSHRYGGTTGLGAGQLGSQYGPQESIGILGGLMGQKQPEAREDDYVQQMIRANSTHNAPFLSKNGSQKANALGNSLTANE